MEHSRLPEDSEHAVRGAGKSLTLSLGFPQMVGHGVDFPHPVTSACCRHRVSTIMHRDVRLFSEQMFQFQILPTNVRKRWTDRWSRKDVRAGKERGEREGEERKEAKQSLNQGRMCGTDKDNFPGRLERYQCMMEEREGRGVVNEA